MRFTFVGCGDAFGSGGRLNTCFHVAGENANFLIDCGASSLVGLKANRIPLNGIGTIFVTHFHADHFGGIPFFMLDAQFFSKRTEPLTIVGPPGLSTWFERVMETAFPGSSKTAQKFSLSLVEIAPAEQRNASGVIVAAFQANHGDPDGPYLSYRFHVEGRIIAYTGDTEWTDELIDAAKDSDLFVAEAYFFEKRVKFHLDVQSIAVRLPVIDAKRVVLTHMSDDVLGRLKDIPYETAHDGLVIDI
ncbi:MAG: MBL fold metallo-hydrolase [Desulfobacteraceae bacterium]|nr:MAG: MBL fold metallo-hydrolase [Desulfobacteraceae bacterium]